MATLRCTNTDCRRFLKAVQFKISNGIAPVKLRRGIIEKYLSCTACNQEMNPYIKQ